MLLLKGESGSQFFHSRQQEMSQPKMFTRVHRKLSGEENESFGLALDKSPYAEVTLGVT